MFSNSTPEKKKSSAIGSTINGLRTIIKYGAYIIVIIEIVQFAIEKLEAVAEKNKPKEEPKDDSKGSDN